MRSVLRSRRTPIAQPAYRFLEISSLANLEERMTRTPRRDFSTPSLFRFAKQTSCSG